MPLTIEALNRSGSAIAGAPVFLLSLTPDTLGIGRDSVSVIGVAPGPGSAQAGVGNLRTAPFPIVVRLP